MEPNEPIEDHPNNLIPVNGALLMDVAADAVIAAWSFIELFCLFYGFLIYQDNYAMILADQVLEFFLRDRAVVTLQAKIRQIRIRADAANVRPPWEVMRRIFTLVPPPPEGNGNLGFPFPPFQPLDGVIQDAADGNMIQGENFAAAAGNMVEQQQQKPNKKSQRFLIVSCNQAQCSSQVFQKHQAKMDSLLFAQKEEEMCLSTVTRVGSKQWRLILKQSTSSLFLFHHFSLEFLEVAILVMQSICI